MSNYKVGDKIRLLVVDKFDNLTVGGIYTITKVDDTTVPVRVLDDNEEQWWLRESQFELVEPISTVFKLAEGTEVECVGLDPYYEVGRIYCVGYDREGEYGVMDDSGDVMSFGRMYSPVGRLCFFKEVDWKVIEPDTSNVETTLKIEEGLEPLTMEQLAAFVYGYSTAGGDMSKVVTLTFEGDK